MSIYVTPIPATDIACRAILPDHNAMVRSVAWHPSGDRLASGGKDSYVHIWSGDGALIGRFGRHTDWVRCLAWRRGNDLLASGCKNGWIWLWDTVAMRLRCTLQAHKESVLDVAWSPDGQTLASASEDGSVRLWSFLAAEPGFSSTHSEIP